MAAQHWSVADKSKDSHDSRIVRLALLKARVSQLGPITGYQPLLSEGIAFIETAAGVGPVPRGVNG